MASAVLLERHPLDRTVRCRSFFAVLFGLTGQSVVSAEIVVAHRDIAQAWMLGQVDGDGRGLVSQFAPPGQAQAHGVRMGDAALQGLVDARLELGGAVPVEEAQ